MARIEESRTDYVITAPWDGIVSKVMVVEGDYVAPRTPLVEIFDPASLVVRFAIPEVGVAKRPYRKRACHIRNARRLSRENLSGTDHPHLSQARPEHAHPAHRGRRCAKDISLTPGLFARIKMNVETHENAVLVPAEAVLVNAKGDRVAFVVQEGKAMARKVSTGIEAGRPDRDHQRGEAGRAGRRGRQ
ncbi:MAG: HlyD family efflux transporter periplasmic adaptor subunit [Desulfobacterales bacterium]|nr:HlyD family efflux transporter periplasmic adaptor subunit [Desulfobacterales bacterium]